jgi:cytochrome c oxidase cbb3-type subunit 2
MKQALFALATFAILAAPPPGHSESGSHRPLSTADAKAGKPLYLRECSACHGERADGNGPGAAFVEPRPRDFTKGTFKLRTTSSGQPPTTADILRTIERGIPGTAMPSFAFLPERERRQIAAYVLDRADLLDGPEPQPIADPGQPPPTSSQNIARGKEVYAQLQCAVCHGEHGKGDGPSSKTLVDDDGRSIPVRDFTTGVFRGGAERKDLYYRFTTGLDGSPMPAFVDNASVADRWALVDYVKSLETPAPHRPLPNDPIQAGRAVAQKYSCQACHVLDDGKGGTAGPDLRISGQKLSSDWIKSFLHAPREYGKIYYWRVARMPQLALSPEEIDAVARYLAAMGRRKPGPAVTPPIAQLAHEKLDEGKLLFMLRCTECHNLGKVIESPPIKWQGPDLIRVAGRVDYDFARRWILDPHKIEPQTKMVVPGLTPEQVDAVRAFVWKASLEAGGTASGGQP